LMDGGNGEDIFRGMLDTEYAKIMAQQGSTGISDMIAKELLKTMQIPTDSINAVRGAKAYEAAQLRVNKNKATID
jgi:Rod binding domain-containing protein